MKDPKPVMIDSPISLRALGIPFSNPMKDPKPVMLDFIICIDRSVRPTYPEWVKKLMHPELECSGPAEYNLQGGVEQWLYKKQKSRNARSNTIYKDLKKTGALASCLNLQDGLAIEQKSATLFYTLFPRKTTLLWGSVVQDVDDDLSVPYLFILAHGKVGLSWHNFTDSSVIGSSAPALRFRE